MRQRPLPLIILPAILLMVAISFPIQIMFLYDHTLLEVSSIYNKLTVLNKAVIILCLLNAYLLFNGRKLALYFTPAVVIATFVNNYWVGKLATDYSMTSTWFASFLFLGINLLVLTPSARSVLENSKKQWWRASPRKKASIPITVNPWIEQTSFATSTFDISESGAFLKLNHNGSNRIPKTIKTNDQIEIKFQLGGFYQIRCSARVVRVTPDKGNYPAGIGIQFDELSKDDQKVIRRFINGEMSL